MFDAHLHIFPRGVPLPGDAGFVPAPFAVEDYRAATAGLGIEGGAVVAASTQDPDPAPLLAAAAALGPGFVVVAEALPEQDEADFARLAALGVRGLRYNLHRRARFGPGEAARHAARAAPFGLHAEIYCDAARLAPHVAALARLPRLALDHLGLSEAGLPVTCDLARAGAKVKATGFGRVSLDVPRALEAIARAAPDSLMAGTDLPSTRAARPFRPDDLALLREVLGPLAAAAFADTAWAFYRGSPPGPRATRP
jgi:predicted TIM-barrel fold metal-dependent hydrolase